MSIEFQWLIQGAVILEMVSGAISLDEAKQSF